MIKKTFFVALALAATSFNGLPQDGGIPPGFKLPPGLAKQAGTLLGGGFVDFSEDLARPAVAVVFGTISKFNEGKRERIEGDSGLGNLKIVNFGTVFYKLECTGDIAVTDSMHGDVKGKSVNCSFNLQSAKDINGKESRQILSEPKHEFDTPFTGLFVLEREKGKKNYQLTRVEKFDIKNDKSADPMGTARKKSADHFGINRRKADYVALLDAYNSARDHKEKENVVKRLRHLVDTKPKWQIVETDPLAGGILAPYEKRAADTIEEFDKSAAAASRPGEKPPEK
ncbi:MAG: hypothetical protein HY286_12935 [Planctomycetes bacterium]|nr:hypothetical protein [Planctomycetota bacterium]